MRFLQVAQQLETPGMLGVDAVYLPLVKNWQQGLPCNKFHGQEQPHHFLVTSGPTASLEASVAPVHAPARRAKACQIPCFSVGLCDEVGLCGRAGPVLRAKASS